MPCCLRMPSIFSTFDNRLKLTISLQAKRAETEPRQGTPTRAHLQPPDYRFDSVRTSFQWVRSPTVLQRQLPRKSGPKDLSAKDASTTNAVGSSSYSLRPTWPAHPCCSPICLASDACPILSRVSPGARDLAARCVHLISMAVFPVLPPCRPSASARE